MDRLIGGTIGISIGGTIYASEVKRRVASITGFSEIGMSRGELETNIHFLKDIQVCWYSCVQRDSVTYGIL